ncbi:MAG: M48 family metalloprotease, partial [Mariprofundaceae bacterium]|nr:M48 family metalloprotease [Mariprofundaceae bacterium]
MNFFGYQEKARRNSAILVALFVLAIALIAAAVYGAVVVGILIGQLFIDQGGFSSDQLWSRELFLWISAGTLLVILGGSAYRIHTLSKGGGSAVAEMLGGSRLPPSAKEPLDRRLLNVVEEMAIASGLPVPPVFILEQPGINAFAAGFTPSDMVIGVTRGAVELLSRDELQGVIAHEFSHIFNGDSAMKMRMMGLLYG